MARRILTPEEQKLWEKVTAGDKPLRDDVKRERVEDVKKKEIPKAKSSKNPPISSSSYPHIPLTPGTYANIDRNTAERFRKGQYPIDAKLDMHGMNREEATAALYHFLHAESEKSSRCLHVITGKGLILRDMLPHWLGADEIRPLLLAFDVAKARHGGAGAYYILLKRKR